MKITKRQLRRIIKEEKTKLIKEQLHMSGRNQGAMEQLHTAIDAMIEEMGRDEAQMELQGIVDDWDQNSYPEHPGQDMVETDKPAAMGEGTGLGNMPDSWRQILGACLKDEK